jgi:hypothetical protein
VSGWLLPAFAYWGLGNSARIEGVNKMLEHSLKDSILTLKKLKGAYQSQLDTRDVCELERVICTLEAIDDGAACKGLTAQSVTDALAIIAKVVSIVSNISELM